MSLFLLDTDHVTLYQMGHPQLLQNVARHLTDQLAISVITVEEQLTGWQAALRQAKDDARREEIYRARRDDIDRDEDDIRRAG